MLRKGLHVYFYFTSITIFTVLYHMLCYISWHVSQNHREVLLMHLARARVPLELCVSLSARTRRRFPGYSVIPARAQGQLSQKG